MPSILKASIFDQVLYEAVKIYREIPEAEAMTEDTFIDDRNNFRWKDVLSTGLRVFIAGIDGVGIMSFSVIDYIKNLIGGVGLSCDGVVDGNGAGFSCESRYRQAKHHDQGQQKTGNSCDCFHSFFPSSFRF